jgi:hypothetical protein
MHAGNQAKGKYIIATLVDQRPIAENAKEPIITHELRHSKQAPGK